MKKILPHCVIWLIKLLRATCRVRGINDPRPEFWKRGQPYIYAGLHAQQIAMVVYAEPGCGSLVSRSKDGDLIAKSLAKTGAVPIRGSAGGGRKGGAAALRGLVNHVSAGGSACLAVDGPKGPRGVISPGVALLSQKTGAPVLPLSLLAHWRKVLPNTWDRTQVPFPFSKIDGTFGDPIYPQDGESTRDYTQRIQDALLALERQCDPVEAAIAQKNTLATTKVTTELQKAA